MVEVKATKCTMYFTEQELYSMLACNQELWETGIGRGKAFKRHQASMNRQISSKEKELIETQT